jgi:hypothetical protein
MTSNSQISPTSTNITPITKKLNNILTSPISPLTNVVLIARFDYESKEQHELNMSKGERFILIDNSKNWWLVRKYDTDQTG